MVRYKEPSEPQGKSLLRALGPRILRLFLKLLLIQNLVSCLVDISIWGLILVEGGLLDLLGDGCVCDGYDAVWI